MQALLRIQVQVAAREAQQALRQLQTTINQVNRAGATVRGGGAIGNMASGAKAATQQMGLLQRISRAVNGDIDRTKMGMIQLGKNMQWGGRQINFNFTIPLILAGKAAMGWALENEQAFTRVRKVYGETGVDYTNELNKIKTALRMLSDYYGVSIKDVTELAAQWAAAGATGAGLAESVKNSLDLSILGDYTDLGDIFTQLITIQTAYKLSAGQLKTAIAELNTTENMTAATLPDLVTGIAKAGSSAELAGVDFQHLAAFMAVLTPATGSAANAGNALKTIFSRLAKPTADTIKALKDLGINVASSSWQVLNGSQKLEFMAEKFGGLTDAQKAFIASSVGARFQVNKFAEIMDSINQKGGTYQKVLAAITGAGADTKNLAAANREIQILLDSDPRKLQIVTNTIKNLLIDAITPAIPFLITILEYIKALFQWFGNLSPAAQKAAVGILILVAAVGIGAQAIGSLRLLFGTFIEFLLWIVQLIPGVSLTAAAKSGEAAAAITTAAGAMTTVGAMEAMAAGVQAAAAQIVAALALLGPAGSAAVAGSATEMSAAIAAGGGEMAIATAGAEAEVAVAAAAVPVAVGAGWIALIGVIVAAVIALIVIFRKQVGSAIESAGSWLWQMMKGAFDGITSVISAIGRAFMGLPRVIEGALEGVVNVVVGLVKVIIHWLSYLNPFARHSPSLVDNVTAGVQAIIDQYARLAGIGGIFRQAASDLAAFTAATQAANDAAKNKDRGEQKATILKTSPQAGPGVDQMFANIDSLTSLLGPINAAVNAQQTVVNDLKSSYDLAAAAVDHFEASMKPLQKVVDDLSTQMDAAQKAVDDYANTNITGMKAASDAIFDNEMAQKKLRLELLQLGDAGQGYDDIRKQIDALNGDIETIRGTMTDLQSSGAGSDILKTYQDQLDSLNVQKDSLTAAAQSGADLTDQLNALQKKGEILDLQKSLNFDPLLRQIDDVANATKELPFDQIIAGITDQKANLDTLTASYDTNKAALDAQQATLDTMVASRDALKQSYDDENATLGVLKDSYSAVTDQINAITDALNAAAAATKTLQGSGGGGGGGGGGVPFEDLTGQFDPTTLDDGLGTMQETIDQWIEDMKKKFGDIKIDPFAFLKKGWHSVQDFWNKHIGPWLIKIPGWVVHGFDVAWDAIWDFFKKLPGRIANFFTSAWNWAWAGGSSIMQGLLDGIGTAAQAVWNWFTNLPGVIAGFFAAAPGWLLTAGEAILQGLWDGIVLIADGLFAWFIGLPAFLTGFFVGAGVWLFKNGIDILQGLWDGILDLAPKVWQWFLDLPGKLTGFFTTALTWLWQKGSDILTGVWNGITDGAKAVWKFFTDLPETLKGYFLTALTWLKEKGSNILQGVIDGIVDKATTLWKWFTDLPGILLGVLEFAGTWLFDIGKQILQGLWEGLKSKWEDVKSWFGDRIQDVKDFFTSGFGILSPSKVFRSYGENMMLGLKNGLASAFAPIPGEVNGMINKINGVMAAGASTFSATANLGSSQLSSGGSARTLTFNGDLSFPNITDPADADKFIQNLEVLASQGRAN